MNNSSFTRRDHDQPGWTFGSHNYGADEFNEVGGNLRRQLGPEFIATRAGPGGSKVQYLEGFKAFNLANDIFGFNGWSTSIVDITVDFVEESHQKVSLGISAIVRVTLKDGTYHEDLGYGSIENAKSKSAAFDKAKKEAITDAVKRALKHFGNSVGNCLYDKEYIKRIPRVSTPAYPFVESELYRYRGPHVRGGVLPTTDYASAHIKQEHMPSGQNNGKNTAAGPSINSRPETPPDEYYGGIEDDTLIAAGDIETLDPRLLAAESPQRTDSFNGASSTVNSKEGLVAVKKEMQSQMPQQPSFAAELKQAAPPNRPASATLQGQSWSNSSGAHPPSLNTNQQEQRRNVPQPAQSAGMKPGEGSANPSIPQMKHLTRPTPVEPQGTGGSSGGHQAPGGFNVNGSKQASPQTATANAPRVNAPPNANRNNPAPPTHASMPQHAQSARTPAPQPQGIPNRAASAGPQGPQPQEGSNGHTNDRWYGGNGSSGNPNGVRVSPLKRKADDSRDIHPPNGSRPPPNGTGQPPNATGHQIPHRGQLTTWQSGNGNINGQSNNGGGGTARTPSPQNGVATGGGGRPYQYGNAANSANGNANASVAAKRFKNDTIDIPGFT
ncbi:DNA repair protein rad52 [Rhizophlyctis rosea]|nr:DNA repair protein rad52 [Rhizophlyctis rosea]